MPIVGPLVAAELLQAGEGHVAVRMVNRTGRRVTFVLPDREVVVDGNSTAAVVVPAAKPFSVERADTGDTLASLPTKEP